MMRLGELAISLGPSQEGYCYAVRNGETIPGTRVTAEATTVFRKPSDRGVSKIAMTISGPQQRRSVVVIIAGIPFYLDKTNTTSFIGIEDGLITMDGLEWSSLLGRLAHYLMSR